MTKADWLKIAKIGVAGLTGAAIPAAPDLVQQISPTVIALLTQLIPDPALREGVMMLVSGAIAVALYMKKPPAKAAAKEGDTAVPNDGVLGINRPKMSISFDEGGPMNFAAKEVPMPKKIQPLSVLELDYSVYDRASFFAATGKQAPPFDDDLPIKRWRDTDGETTFNFINHKTGKIETKDLGALAAMVNLPGLPIYHPWKIEPTQAKINPLFLSTREQADAIAEEWGLDPSAAVTSPLYEQTEWNGEKRQAYQIMYGGNGYNVGGLLRKKYQQGVDHPGAWDMTGEFPEWVPDQLSDGSKADPEKEIHPPVRPLAEGERIEPGPTPFQPWVLVTGEDTPAGGSDSAAIDQILALVKSIDARLKQLSI